MNYDKISIKNRFKTHKYRYLRAGLYQDVTLQELLDLFANHNGICDLCDKHMEPADTEIDHIISISNGGPHTINNMQLVHKKCNNIKRDKDNDLAKWLCQNRHRYRHCRHCDCIKPLTMWTKGNRCALCSVESASTWNQDNRERFNARRNARRKERKDLAETEPSHTNYASATF